MNTVFNEPNGRSVINDAQSKTGYIRRQQWTTPLAANATKILSAHALDGSTVTTFAGQPDFPRNVQIVASGSATGNVVVNGTNIRGDVISETIALNGATPVLGLHAFKTVTSIVLPTVASTTINVGIGAKLGLDRRMMEQAVIDAYADGVREATAATITYDGATTSLNTITTNTAPNGTHNFSVNFISTELTDKVGTTSLRRHMAKQYIVDGNIIHDQQPYKTGDTIMLEDNQAVPLLALGRIKLDETQPVETSTQATEAPQVNPATDLNPASPHNMTSQQTGEPMTAAPSGAQVGPEQPLPPATTTPEIQTTVDQPGTGESTSAASQTTTTTPTPEQINADMEQLG